MCRSISTYLSLMVFTCLFVNMCYCVSISFIYPFREIHPLFYPTPQVTRSRCYLFYSLGQVLSDVGLESQASAAVRGLYNQHIVWVNYNNQRLSFDSGIHPPIHQTLVGGCQAAKFEAVAVILLPYLHGFTCETMGNCGIFRWS